MPMKKYLLLTLIFSILSVCGFSQAKKITVEDIWDNFAFYPRGVAGYTAMPVSDDYTVIKRAGIERHHFSDGSVAGIILSHSDLTAASKERLSIPGISEYAFSSDEKKSCLPSTRRAFTDVRHWRIITSMTLTARSLLRSLTQLTCSVLLSFPRMAARWSSPVSVIFTTRI